MDLASLHLQYIKFGLLCLNVKKVHIVVSEARLLKPPNPCITKTVEALLLSIDLIL